MLAPEKLLQLLENQEQEKTTLARLMVGIIEPSLGRVVIDQAKLQNYNREFLGKYIGYLPQQVEFVAGTIKENIARMEEKH